jgi:AsmA protein
MAGRLDGDLTLAGAGRDWEAIRPSLRGGGRVDVRNGVLRDVNLADAVLGRLTGLPGLTALVPRDVRERYPEGFSTGDTRFEELGGTVRIADDRATSDDLALRARDYSVLGKGFTTLDGRVDLTATLVASERLTGDIVRGVKEARWVTNQAGRVAVPFRLTGTLPRLRVLPDTGFVTQAVGRGLVDKGVGALRDALDGGKKKGKGDTDALRKGLEGLFGR